MIIQIGRIINQPSSRWIRRFDWIRGLANSIQEHIELIGLCFKYISIHLNSTLITVMIKFLLCSHGITFRNLRRRKKSTLLRRYHRIRRRCKYSWCTNVNWIVREHSDPQIRRTVPPTSRAQQTEDHCTLRYRSNSRYFFKNFQQIVFQ